MPLTPYQAEVAKLLATARSEDSYLAGGAALHLLPNSLRYSNDLDFFNDSAERVTSAFAADQRLLIAAGHAVDILVNRLGLVLAVVSRGGERTKVEWLHDTAWRFLPTVPDELVGFRLHPVDLAINKLLALVGREEPRDYLDVLYAHERILPLGAQIWAAAGKDPGFSPTMLLSMLRRKGRYRAEDFAPLRLVSAPDLVQSKLVWLAALDAAEAYLATLPPEELGCLYYDTTRATFTCRPSTHEPQSILIMGDQAASCPSLQIEPKARAVRSDGIGDQAGQLV